MVSQFPQEFVSKPVMGKFVPIHFVINNMKTHSSASLPSSCKAFSSKSSGVSISFVCPIRRYTASTAMSNAKIVQNFIPWAINVLSRSGFSGYFHPFGWLLHSA